MTIHIASLIPHAGAMVLLDTVIHWDADHIRCTSRTHRDPANPLRRAGHVAIVGGIEYGLQAAALHGALRSGGQCQVAGYVASLRAITFTADHLDGADTLQIEARLEAEQPTGMLYAFTLTTQDGLTLLQGRASIALPR